MRRRRQRQNYGVLNEEIDPATKNNLLNDLKSEISRAVDNVMMIHGVESRGLSQQQAAFVAQEIDHTVQAVLDDFKSEAAASLSKEERDYLEQR